MHKKFLRILWINSHNCYWKYICWKMNVNNRWWRWDETRHENITTQINNNNSTLAMRGNWITSAACMITTVVFTWNCPFSSFELVLRLDYCNCHSLRWWCQRLLSCHCQLWKTFSKSSVVCLYHWHSTSKQQQQVKQRQPLPLLLTINDILHQVNSIVQYHTILSYMS